MRVRLSAARDLIGYVRRRDMVAAALNLRLEPGDQIVASFRGGLHRRQVMRGFRLRRGQ